MDVSGPNSTDNNPKSLEWEDNISIPTPWGHIQAKTYGTKQNPTVICAHGLLDNAGSFDGLIPLLPKNYFYVSIDLPGHGLSSHLNVPYDDLTFVLAIKIVSNYFKRVNYIYMGHSFGAKILMLYTQLYPENVRYLIVIDSMYFIPIDAEEYFIRLKEAIEGHLKLFYNNESRPVFGYEEIVNRVKDNRLLGYLTYESAEVLAKRMIKKVGADSYQYTFDSNLKKYISLPSNIQYIQDLLKTKPLNRTRSLWIIMSESFDGVKRYKEYIKPLQMSKNVKFVKINGHHHMHNTNPEIVAEPITKFLLESQNKL